MSDKSLTHKQILTLLAGGPSHIAGLTAGMSAERLQTAPGPGEWSANDVLAHLRSCADVWGDCIAVLLAQDRPTIRAINPRTWIKSTNYLEQEFHPSLQAFTAQRTGLLSLLEALAPEDWTREADVTGAGKPLVRSVHFYAQWMATHERPHLKQIQRIVSA